MKPLSADTSPEAQRVLTELLRSASPSRKLELTCGLTQALRELILADIRRQFPNATAEVVHQKLVSRLLPREDVIRAYGFDPDPPTDD